MPVGGAGGGFAGFDEVGKVGLVADPVADEAQPGQSSFNQLALGWCLAYYDGVVGV
jgi:hypothetical protein